jgi:hypothetical protein
LNQESWVGTTVVQENQGNRQFQLYGADALITLSPNNTITAEYARSQNNFDNIINSSQGNNQVSGSAYRIEGNFKLNETNSARTFYRSTDAGFTNNATTSFVPGQTRYGGELTTRLNNNTNVRLVVEREDNKGVAPAPLVNYQDLLTPRNNFIPGSQLDNSLTTITAGVQQRLGNISLDLDYVNRSREDRLPVDSNQTNINSSQLRSRVGVPLANNLTFRGVNELNLNQAQDPNFPNRTFLGLEWAVHPGVNLRLGQNFISGGQYEDSAFTSLDLNSKYQIATNTNVTGRYSLTPFQSIGAIGLQQGIILSPGFKVDVNYERLIGSSGFNSTGSGKQFAQPATFGQGSASSGTGNGDSLGIGITYSDNPNYQVNARYEQRSSTSGTNTVLSGGVTGKLSPQLTALVRYQQTGVANQTLSSLGDNANLRVGLAYRDPQNDQINALLSYQYRKNPGVLPESILSNIGTGYEDHTLATEGIYAPNWQWEFYGKLGLRNGTNYLDKSLTSNSTLLLTQLRTTYRLGYDWDLVGDLRWINQPSTGYSETGLNLEAGYYLTPNLRLGAGYGFGRVTDDTTNIGRSSSGPYVGLTVKLDDFFGFGTQQTQQIEVKSKE